MYSQSLPLPPELRRLPFAPWQLGRRRGFSLIELAMVLAIIALMVAGVMLLFANADGQKRSNETIEEVYTIAMDVKQLYQGTSTYLGITDQQIAQSGLLPSKWTVGGAGQNAAGIVDPFSGAIVINPSTSVTYGDSWQMTLHSISNNACLAIAVADFGGYGSVRIIDNIPSADNVHNTTPFLPATASAICNAGGAANNNHVIILYFT